MRLFLLFSSFIAAASLIAGPTPGAGEARRASGSFEHLDLAQAEAIALRQSPSIMAAQLKALAAKQVVREVRSAFFPQITAEFSAVATGDDIADHLGWNRFTNKDTRIGASGGLNNPTVLSRQSNGILFSQLITDFGRTWDLTAASKSQALSEAQRSELVRARVVLLVDQSYFRVLQAQALLRVADETVMARQLVSDHVGALARSQLKSELDASFARVSLDEAKLLQLEARNRVEAAFADLSAALGYPEPHRFVLSEVPRLKAPDSTLAELIARALAQRPEVLLARHDREAAARLASAERAAHLPKVSLIGAAGRTTAGDPRVEGDYAAAGVNVELPLFSGFRISARAQEAAFHARAAEQSVRDVEDSVAKDVQVALLNTTTSADRIDVTAHLLANAEQAYDLAEAKYKTGSTSLVEFSQAQLLKLQAQINHTAALYEYQINRLVLDFQAGLQRSPANSVLPNR